MKQVHCFEIASKTRALEADYIEFHTRIGRNADQYWRPAVNSSDHVARVERVAVEIHRVHAEGEDFYVAIHPWAVDKLALALQPEMASREARLVADLASAEADRVLGWERASEASSDYQRAKAKLMEIAGATFWQRVKYLFTGSFQ
jgi:hypothetical protein